MQQHDRAEAAETDQAEQPQAILLAEPYQQQVHAEVGHRIDRGNPRNLVRLEPERTEQFRRIHRYERVAEATGKAQQDAYCGADRPSPDGLVGVGGAAAQRRPLGRGEIIVLFPEGTDRHANTPSAH